MFVGDERVRQWSCNKLNLHTYLTYCYYEDDCTFTRAVQLANEHLTSDTKVLIIQAFHYDFIYKVGDIPCAKSISVVHSLMPIIESTLAAWSLKFPELFICFIMPYAIDFNVYNRCKTIKMNPESRQTQKIIVKNHKSTNHYGRIVHEFTDKFYEKKTENVTLLHLEHNSLVTRDGLFITKKSTKILWELLRSTIEILLAKSSQIAGKLSFYFVIRVFINM